MTIRVALLVMALVTPGTPLAQTPNIDPGQWRFETRIQLSGAVQMPERTQRNTECITRQQIERGPEALLDNLVLDCELGDQQLDAEGMTYTMTCALGAGQGMVMEGDLRFLGDRVEGTNTGTVQAGGQTLRMRLDTTGARLGDC